MKLHLLRLEALLALLLAWGLVFLLPQRLVRRVTRPGATGAAIVPHIMGRAVAVCVRLNRVATRLPWQSTCLVRAVAGTLLLRRRGIGGAVIRFGVRKRQAVLEAHAWLLLGDTILLGDLEIGSYAPLADLSRGEDA